MSTVGSAAAAVGASGMATARPERTVEINVGYSADRGKQAALDAATRVVREFDSIPVVTVEVPIRAADRLSNRPDVRYVEKNGEMHALAQTLPWGIDRVDADAVHAEGNNGYFSDIAIVDTGIDSDHPDLSANLGAGESFVGSSWEDDNGHGTHVAGIADAVDNDQGVVGVATDATLHAVKVLDSGGSGTYSDVAAGIEHVADQGWNVANMSLGGGASSTVQDAVQYADGQGVLLVAAAGNSGPCTDCVTYPAAYSEVLAVSATDQNDDLADFSSQGPEIDLAAPGKDIYSTYPGGYATLSGTSMACPHVAGAGALLISKGFTADEAASRLSLHAEDLGLPSEQQGSGLLDVQAPIEAPEVETDGAYPEQYSATLQGDLTYMGSASSAEVYFEWGESLQGLTNRSAGQTLTSTGIFDETISGLESETAYIYRAVVDTSDGDSDTGAILQFSTTSGGGGRK